MSDYNQGTNFDVLTVDGGVPVYMWNHGVTFEEAAVKQLANLAKIPFIYKHVAAMPDCHWGMGSTVGSVFASDGAVIPASVGVDIGCGMMAMKTVMSKLRPECSNHTGTPLPNDTALYLIRDAVFRRRTLIHGRLHNGVGQHCAMGCFWTDNPDAIVNSSLVDEVAAVNDSVPVTATAQERWKKVNSWLRFKLASLANGKAKGLR
jgi:hypothetical protein